MGSKAIVFLGLLLAMVLLISSEVAARDLVETTDTVDTSKESEEPQVGRMQYGGGYYPPRGGYYPPRGGYYPPRGGYYPPRGGGYCRYGCCGRGYYGRCRCCGYAGQAVDADFMGAETHN